jgi:hypothetical protein
VFGWQRLRNTQASRRRSSKTLASLYELPSLRRVTKGTSPFSSHAFPWRFGEYEFRTHGDRHCQPACEA